ncbi:AEC family transporter [Roseococcus sp. YIM B11640]|uniref:AEC family transporter n=1 Tax=Roseococcus sp. YIM B11640 TaxID=3133973 RepID=UPI003C79BA04
MLPYIDAFVPCFGMLALGALLKRKLLPHDVFWAGIERLIFWVLLPSLLVAAIGSVKLGEVPILGMLAAIWVGLGSGTVLSLLVSRRFRQPHASMTSVLMGGIRFNNLIGFAVAGAMFGLPGLALGAVSSGLIVPFVQFVSNTAFASEKGFRPWPILRQIMMNPLMLACVVGFLVAWLGGLPPGVKPLLESLGRASVALGLLAVGAALSAGALTDRVPLQLATAAVKLLLVPAITLGICLWLGLEPLPTAMAVLFMALPTAATSYVMARAMGGDAPLMAAITSSEHFLSILTLPLWMLLVKMLTGLG